MPALKLTAHAVSCEIGHEMSLILTMLDGDTELHQVRNSRATGPALAVSSAIAALLYARSVIVLKTTSATRQNSISLSSVELIVDPDVYEAVVGVCEFDEILIPEAVNSLLGISQLVKQNREEGLTITFSMGISEPSNARQSDFENAKAREYKKFMDRQNRVEAWQLPVEDAKWVEENNATVIYTDGACISSTGFSAWAWYVNDELNGSGTVAPASSSYAERRAVLEALTAISGPVLIISDHANILLPPSARVLAAREERVLKSLRRMVKMRQVRILTVRGHSDCPGNIAVDRIASSALADSWAKVAADAELRQRITALHVQARENLKEARRLADVRRDLHRELYESNRYPRTLGRSEGKRKKRPRRAKVAA